jgi:hypothetical protein
MTTTNQDKSKIVARIKRLLKLSQSLNENEALRAALKAQELLVFHNISLSDIDNEDNNVIEHKVETFGNIPMWKKALLFAIASSNFCVAIVKPLGEKRKCVFFVGKPANSIVAEILYSYLRNEIQRLARLSVDKSHTYKTNFMLGCAVRISQRLQEELKQQEENGIHSGPDCSVSAIVVSSLHKKNTAEIEVYLESKKVKKGRKNKPQIKDTASAIAYRDGFDAGDKINLNKQIKGAE